MGKPEQAPRPAPTKRAKPSAGEKREQKQRVLTQKKPSQLRSIADAVVVKDEDLFFLCARNGQVPLRGRHGFGLYYHDCRFLNGYEFRLAGRKPNPLAAAPREGFKAALELLSPGFRDQSGRRVEKEDVGVSWRRVLDASRQALHDQITVHNHGQEPVEFPISLTFRADFEDVFVVRGLLGEKLGTAQPPRWEDEVLCFLYEGSDGLWRSAHVYLSPRPERTEGTTAHFRVSLPARQSKEFRVAVLLAEAPEREEAQALRPPRFDPDAVEVAQGRSSDARREHQPRVRSESRLLDAIMERSLRDLRVLRSSRDGQQFYAAGVPWFATLFGRDSLLAALQTLAYEPDLAAQTLRLLARYQGDETDDWRDEQPGKILHELRVGELARTGRIPHTPYYGSIDATPLFLILLGRHAAWTGKLDLFEELRGPAERALAWMAGSCDPNGYLAYHCTSDKGLVNQGWKDSGDAIVNADGSLCQPPIALVEVQGYAYRAKLSMADLYARAGDAGRARQLRREADALRERFNRDFWLEDRGCYALALQAGGRPAAVISSNPGQALWCGIAEPDKARRTAERLLADDMFNGWGVRTLSAQERRYNPVGYHLGTVWPHDNALLAAGFRRYGLDDAVRRVFAGITEAAMHFDAYRLPEVFAGFGREDFGVPVHYPVACHPQAWAAGTVPYLLETLLGLEPEGFDHRLRIVRPLLLEWVDRLELRRLRVGDATVDLSFRRTGADGVEVEVLHKEGTLEVVTEPHARK